MYGVSSLYPPFCLSAAPCFIGLLQYPKICFLTISTAGERCACAFEFGVPKVESA